MKSHRLFGDEPIKDRHRLQEILDGPIHDGWPKTVRCYDGVSRTYCCREEWSHDARERFKKGVSDAPS